MRQLVFLQPSRLEWQEAPEPSLQGPGEALVRPLAIATCDLDAVLTTFTTKFLTTRPKANG